MTARTQGPEETFVRAWVPFVDFPFSPEAMLVNAEDQHFRAQMTHAINAIPALLRVIDALEAGR